MRRLAVAAIAFMTFAGTQAEADSLPLPTVDYQATAQVDAAGQSHEVRMRHHEGLFMMEMDAGGLPGKVIIDQEAGTGVMVMTVEGATMVMDLPASQMDMAAGYDFGGAEIEPTGDTETVAGEECEIYRIGDGSAESPNTGTACITEDGILMRLDAMLANNASSRMEVRSLERAPQDPSLFAVPAGAMRMRMDDMMQGVPGN